jgi:hypothetical protein
VSLALALACGGSYTDTDLGRDTQPDSPGQDVMDAADDAYVPCDNAIDVLADVWDDAVPDADDIVDSDSTVDPDVPLPPLPTQASLAVPADPLEGSDVESCAVYQEEQCNDGSLVRCELYDTAAGVFVDVPDPMLQRAMLFDRWRDLYNSPVGQAIDRDFVNVVEPGTPESEWGAPENLAGYFGAGDGGIWTGWSTVASVLRYAQTGTEADYQRMEQHVRDMLLMYEVTGIPGYLSRYHYLVVPDGTPPSNEYVLRWEGSYQPNHHDRDVAASAFAFLPAAYTEGVPGPDGELVVGQARWKGRPSIDQNTGPMTSLPMAHGLLRDEALKQRIVHHLTCYLKRLQRIELINLQDNPDLLASLMSYFNTGELKLDPEDIDLTKLNRIVGYVHRQINTLNEADYDRSCPDSVQMEPWRVIDATSDEFILDILNFVMDMDVDAQREDTIDHFYFPSIRGGDAMHLMHLATMAYHLTGDDQYREFLYRELIGNINADQIMHTVGAFDLPRYCKKYYGDQITYGPWWAFLHLIGDSPLKTEVQKAFHGEMWDKLVKPNANVDFNIMYAGALPADIALDRDAALAEAMDLLPRMGGNGWVDDAVVSDDPRRSYVLSPDMVMAKAPEGTEAVCPTQAQIDMCTAEVDFMGVKLPGLGITNFPCTGSDWECDIGGGKCTPKMTNLALPPDLRPYTDYLWQRNPFAIGAGTGKQGGRQYAGSDLSVPYWNARLYGFITEGTGQVLAWKVLGECD